MAEATSSARIGLARFTAGIALAALLTVLVSMPARAEDPREEAVVTLRSGGLVIELQQAHSWSIQKISYRGVVVGTQTGAFGALVCVPVSGGWVGSMHTAGGVEKVEDASLIVDGDFVELSDGATYSGERIVLQKRSTLDKLQLNATLTLAGGVLTQRHEISATEDVVVTAAYPFMFPLAAGTSRWMAVTGEREEIEGEFGAGDALTWNEDWTWTAAYIPDRSTGVVIRHLARPDDVASLVGWWDQERHHKLYVSWDGIAEPWPEGLTLQGEVALSCFEAPPVGWHEMARQVASELVAE